MSKFFIFGANYSSETIGDPFTFKQTDSKTRKIFLENNGKSINDKLRDKIPSEIKNKQIIRVFRNKTELFRAYGMVRKEEIEFKDKFIYCSERGELIKIYV